MSTALYIHHLPVEVASDNGPDLRAHHLPTEAALGGHPGLRIHHAIAEVVQSRVNGFIAAVQIHHYAVEVVIQPFQPPGPQTRRARLRYVPQQPGPQEPGVTT